jgi:hypothetical protein
MRRFLITCIISIVFYFPAYPEADSTNVPEPSFKQVLSLKSVGSPVISPDGKSIVYTVRSVDWKVMVKNHSS